MGKGEYKVNDDNYRLRLTPRGHRLRTRLAEHGFEVTPDELAMSIKEEWLGHISWGACASCGRRRELRYGMCIDCIFPEIQEVPE